MDRAEFTEGIRQWKRENPAIASDPNISEMLDGALYRKYASTGSWAETFQALTESRETIYQAVGLPLPPPTPEEHERKAAEEFEAMRQRSADHDFDASLDLQQCGSENRARMNRVCGIPQTGHEELAAREALMVRDPLTGRMVDVEDLREREKQDAELRRINMARFGPQPEYQIGQPGKEYREE